MKQTTDPQLERFDLIFDTGLQFLQVKIDDQKLRDLGMERPEELALRFGRGWQPDASRAYLQYWLKRTGTYYEVTIAVDTSQGPVERGYCAGRRDPADYSSVRSLEVVPSLFYEGEESIEVDLCRIQYHEAAQRHDTLNVVLCIDLGNSRTSLLAIEPPEHRQHLDHHCFEGIALQNLVKPFEDEQLVFESAFEFRPLRDFAPPESLEYRFEMGGRGAKQRLRRLLKQEVVLDDLVVRFKAETFAIPSIGAVGAEAVHWREKTEHPSPPQTGYSSPKRYLWSDSPHPLVWSFGLPPEEAGRLEPISGEPLQFVSHDDSDAVLNQPRGAPLALRDPEEPKYPRRMLSSLFISEILLRSFWYLNTSRHRNTTNRPLLRRRIKHVVVTYPSVFGPEDRTRLELQVKKGLRIFESVHPGGAAVGGIQAHVSWDEGVASQLFYLAHSKDSIFPEKMAKAEASGAASVHVGKGSSKSQRIASIDIGGGTIDVAVVDYRRGEAIGEKHCKVLLVDGTQAGGDDLCRSLVTEAVVPGLLEALDILSKDARARRLQRLFLGRTDATTKASRIRIIRTIFLPMAYRILEQMRDSKPDDVIQLNMADLHDVEVVEELARVLFGDSANADSIRSATLEIDLASVTNLFERFLSPHLDPLVEEVGFQNPDVVLLCGRIASLPIIRKIAARSLVGGDARIVVFGEDEALRRECRRVFHDAGDDPKLSVVLGAAMAVSSELGMSLGADQFTLDYSTVSRGFTWGFVDPVTSLFTEDFLLHSGDGAECIKVLQGRHLIGRRHNSRAGGKAVPEYEIACAARCEVMFRRTYDETLGQERLEILHADGAEGVDVQRVSLNREYWLDSGELEL